MIIGAIIVGVLILALMVLGTYINERYRGNFDAGIFIGAGITWRLKSTKKSLIEATRKF